MRKGVLLGLAGLALLWAQPAQADGYAWDNYCINDAFVVCASVRINVNSSGVLTMQVWNMEGALFEGNELGIAHTITAVGLYHTGGWGGTGSLQSAAYVTGGGSSNITDYWQSNANEIKTLGGVNVRLSSATKGNAGINGCTLLPGSPDKWQTCDSFDSKPFVQFTFKLDSWDYGVDKASDFELRWHSKQVAGEYSLKCDTGGYGDYGPCTQVPEPFTIALLGSGLASMGGVALRRRKKEQDL